MPEIHPCCEKCQLFKKARHPFLPPVGDRDPDILIVGKAPATVEDRVGEIFTGNSGVLLKDILKEAMSAIPDHSRPKIMMTNILRCRYPAGEAIKAEHYNNCLYFLLKVIKRTRPKTIITLGKEAMNILLPHRRVGKNTDIANCRGCYFPYRMFGRPSLVEKLGDLADDLHVVPTYLTTLALESPLKYQQILHDIRCAINWTMHGRTLPETDYRMIKTLSELKAVLEDNRKAKFCGFDIETNDMLSPFWRRSRILCMSIGFRPYEAWNIPFKRPLVEALMEYLARKDVIKVLHNAKFDLLWWRVITGQWVSPPVFCVMLAHQIIDPAGQHGLKRLAWEDTDMGGYDWVLPFDLEDKEVNIDFEMLAAKDPDRLALYNCGDVDITLQLFLKYAKKIRNEMPPKLYTYMWKVIFPMIFSYAKMELNGMYFDREGLLKLYHELPKKIEMLRESMRKLKVVKAWEERTGKEYNPNSHQHNKQILTDMGLDLVVKDRGTLKASTAKEVIEPYARKHKLIEFLLQHRVLAKLYGTYVNNMLEHISEYDGRIHSSFSVLGARSGRRTSRDPNLQNVSKRRGEEIRKEVKPRPGYKLVELDYRQLEPRITACFCKDPNMVRVFREGRDIYCDMVNRLWGTPVDKVDKRKERDPVKSIFLGIIYGMGINEMARRAGFSVRKAQRVLDDLFKHYHLLARWRKQVQTEAKTNLYVETMAGRRRYLPDLLSTDRARREAALRQAINTPIQGTASELVGEVHVLLNDFCKKNKGAAYLIGEVHDSLLFEVRASKGEDYLICIIKELLDIMENGAQHPWMLVPFPAEAKYGDNWLEMESVPL